MSSELGWGRWLDDLAGAAAPGRGGGRASPGAVLRAKGAVGRLVGEAGLGGGRVGWVTCLTTSCPSRLLPGFYLGVSLCLRQGFNFQLSLLSKLLMHISKSRQFY